MGLPSNFALGYMTYTAACAQFVLPLLNVAALTGNPFVIAAVAAGAVAAVAAVWNLRLFY
ncbi:MAG: hypothetical protein ACK5LZ_02095 [Anaerorhabdus sp.]